ncbi:MAG: hypothetical protein M1155_02905 [Patescibacteria group bacterium]|nr:hypothetical protein [Patescibacteria group bacterium]
MVEKLRSALRIVRSQLLLKAAAFALLLFWAKISGFSALSIFFFFLISVLLYFGGRVHSTAETLRSFIVLLFVSLFGVDMLNHFQFLIPAIVAFSFIFYIILGIKELAFARRPKWNYAKNILLSYLIFLTYFLSNRYDWFFGKYFLVFFGIVLLVTEWLFWLEKDFLKRRRVIALVISFLSLQLLWAVSLLPLGFINSATLMTVFVYIMLDFCKHHFRGTISKELIWKHFLVLCFSFAVIFAFTNWKI